MKTELKTNVEEVVKQFKDLTYKEMKRTTRSALRRGAFILAKATKRNIKSLLPAATKRSEKYNDRMIQGVVYGAYKKGNSGFVHILGTNKTGSGTYRLRFFEKGTVVRKHRNGRYIGKIQALNFFSMARASSKTDVSEAMEEQIIKMIKRINEKKQSSEA